MKTLVVDCLKCHEPLSPKRVRAQLIYCTYCEAIDKGEQEAKHRQELAESIHKANARSK